MTARAARNLTLAARLSAATLLAVVTTPAPAEPLSMTPRDAGARYGQTLGAIEICYGAKVTDASRKLAQIYAGADQEIFKAQAAKVYDAWRQVKNCANGLDPNQCKIIMDKSCATAEAEIGASGTIFPGLVEFMKR
ncbi:MAG TPA: hypothetical protein PLD46_03470 [Hyphomicrobium sp.]|nr:hypothetical protein [Hyphomicrobium sp.]